MADLGPFSIGDLSMDARRFGGLGAEQVLRDNKVIHRVQESSGKMMAQPARGKGDPSMAIWSCRSSDRNPQSPLPGSRRGPARGSKSSSSRCRHAAPSTGFLDRGTMPDRVCNSRVSQAVRGLGFFRNAGGDHVTLDHVPDRDG